MLLCVFDLVVELLEIWKTVKREYVFISAEAPAHPVLQTHG